MVSTPLDRHVFGKSVLKTILFWLIMQLMVWCPSVQAKQPIKKLPGDAAIYLPILVSEIDTYWPNLYPREYMAAKIDQESNWKVNAHLRTQREHGCGFGQFTIAYRKDGSVRFDALSETKRLDKSLADWDWQDCTNALYQLRGTVLKTKSEERSCVAIMRDNINAKACGAAKYNGGAGSINKRVRFCRATPGCEPDLWTDNLEKQCPQSQVKVKGYGESFCEINSKYPARVFARMKKFNGLMFAPEVEILKPVEPPKIDEIIKSTEPLTSIMFPKSGKQVRSVVFVNNVEPSIWFETPKLFEQHPLIQKALSK
jgi:hypothetical protein